MVANSAIWTVQQRLLLELYWKENTSKKGARAVALVDRGPRDNDDCGNQSKPCRPLSAK